MISALLCLGDDFIARGTDVMCKASSVGTFTDADKLLLLLFIMEYYIWRVSLKGEICNV